MLTEDYRPGVEGRLGSKTTCFPGKTSRVTWDQYAKPPNKGAGGNADQWL